MSIDAPTIVALWSAPCPASADKTAMLVKRDGAVSAGHLG